MVLILFVGAILVARRSLNPGDVVAMTGFFGVFTKLDGDVAELVEKIPVIRNLLDRMDSIYEGGEEKIEDLGKAAESKNGSLFIWKIEVNKLAFSYALSEAAWQEKKDAPILLLDEPDNHLDTEIQESLREILKGEQRIVFSISHRKLGAEWTADKVINLDSGE